MADNSEFSGRLLLARSQAGMTQKELAEKSGVSAIQIMRYENGLSNPRLRAVLKLAEALKIDARSLMLEATEENTSKISISFPDDEFRQLRLEANRRDIPIEELTRRLSMLGLRLMDLYPVICSAIENADLITEPDKGLAE